MVALTLKKPASAPALATWTRWRNLSAPGCNLSRRWENDFFATSPIDRATAEKSVAETGSARSDARELKLRMPRIF